MCTNWKSLESVIQTWALLPSMFQLSLPHHAQSHCSFPCPSPPGSTAPLRSNPLSPSSAGEVGAWQHAESLHSMSESLSGPSPVPGFTSSAAEVAGTGGGWPWAEHPKGKQPAGAFGSSEPREPQWNSPQHFPGRHSLRGPGAAQGNTSRNKQCSKAEELFQSKVWLDSRCSPSPVTRAAAGHQGHWAQHCPDTTGTQHHRESAAVRGRNAGQEHAWNAVQLLFIHI